MPIDLTALTYAVDKLETRLERYQADPLDLLIRDAVIYRFNAAYHQTCIALRSALNVNSCGQLQPVRLTFVDMIKSSIEQGLLRGKLSDWIEHRETRNLTAEAYEHEKAEQAASRIPKFAQDAERVVSCLEHRLNELTHSRLC